MLEIYLGIHIYELITHNLIYAYTYILRKEIYIFLCCQRYICIYYRKIYVYARYIFAGGDAYIRKYCIYILQYIYVYIAKGLFIYVLSAIHMHLYLNPIAE